MSSTEIWVILPLGLALLTFLLRYRTLLIYFSAVITTFWLALLAWLIPFDQAILVGSISVKVTETFEILGREFTLSNADRPFLVLLYLFTSLWILAGYFIKPDHLFAPFALGMVASLTAALAVEPFLFAAMIIEIISLLAVPLLAPPGQPSGKGVLRFLAFQTIGYHYGEPGHLAA